MSGIRLNKFRFSKRAPAVVLCLLGALLSIDAWAAAAGHFLFVVGDVRVAPAAGGNAVRVRRGAEVQPGDTVITTARGIAQLRMVDGAQIAVRPATKLRIDEYRFEQPEAEDRSFFSLLSGAFRSVTGLIGQRDNAAYRVTTSTATIGIRGSDADIGFNAETQLTAVRTYEGAHVLTARGQTGPAASLVTGPGDIAVVMPGIAPRFAAEFPFQTAPVPPAPGEGGAAKKKKAKVARMQARAAGEEGDGKAASAATGDRRAAPRTLGPPPPPPKVIVSVAGASALNVVRPAPFGSTVAGGYIGPDSTGTLSEGAGSVVLDGPNSIAVLGPSDEVVLVLDTDAFGAFMFLAGDAKLRVVKQFAIADATGGVAARGSWGLWQGDFVVVDDGRRVDAIGGFPFAIADRTTRPAEIAALGGTAFSYSRIGGTATNEKGALPTSYALSATGTFGSGAGLGSISFTGSANFASGSTGWTMTASGSIADLITDSMTLSAGCAGCSTPIGEIGGQFVGSRAEGLLVGFGSADAVSGSAIVGSGVFKRGP